MKEIKVVGWKVKAMSLLEKIKNGETRTLEFKKELPTDSIKWI